MNDFDKAARFAARLLDPLGFFRWLLGAEFFRAWRWSRWLDTQSVPFPGEPDRRLDTVAAFVRQAADALPSAVVVEFLSEPRRAVLERLGEYTLRIRRELPYQIDPWVPYDVIGVLVNLTGQTMTGEWSMTPPDAGGLGLWARFEVRNLGALEASSALSAMASGETARCVLPWVSLMRGGGEAATVAEWKRLAEVEPDRERRREYAGLALVFADLANCTDVWEKELEGWNVRRSRITLEWERKARDEGRTEGLTEGVAIRTRAMILRALQVRLGQSLPTEVTQAVENQSDQATLDRWFDLALSVGSVEEVRQAFGINGAAQA